MIGLMQFQIYLLAFILIAVGMTAWLLDARLTALLRPNTQIRYGATGLCIFMFACGAAVTLVILADAHAVEVAEQINRELKALEQSIRQLPIP